MGIPAYLLSENKRAGSPMTAFPSTLKQWSFLEKSDSGRCWGLRHLTGKGFLLCSQSELVCCGPEDGAAH